MTNIETKVENSILTIKIDLKKEFGRSASGKTIQVASTQGNIKISDNPEIFLGVNAYKKP